MLCNGRRDWITHISLNDLHPVVARHGKPRSTALPCLPRILVAIGFERFLIGGIHVLQSRITCLAPCDGHELRQGIDLERIWAGQPTGRPQRHGAGRRIVVRAGVQIFLGISELGGDLRPFPRLVASRRGKVVMASGRSSSTAERSRITLATRLPVSHGPIEKSYKNSRRPSDGRVDAIAPSFVDSVRSTCATNIWGRPRAI